MARIPGELPTPDPGRELWERLRDDDPTAPAELAATYVSPLVDWLIEHNRHVDPDLCETAAGDAIIALNKNPATYKPELQKLEVYLRMSASGDLKNLLRGERRHRARRAGWESVELSPVVGKYLQDVSEDPSLVVEREESELESRESASAVLMRVRQDLSPEDSPVLDLMLAGERKTAVYALALGLRDRPVEEQERIVKQAKDRIKKRIQRARIDHE